MDCGIVLAVRGALFAARSAESTVRRKCEKDQFLVSFWQNHGEKKSHKASDASGCDAWAKWLTPDRALLSWRGAVRESPKTAPVVLAHGVSHGGIPVMPVLFPANPVQHLFPT